MPETAVHTKPSPKIFTKPNIRRPDDVSDDNVKMVAALWWEKHRTDCLTVWFQGLQTQPRHTIMAMMSNSVPGLALHSEPQDRRFFDEIERLFIEYVS